jgi:hypothetical protein
MRRFSATVRLGASDSSCATERTRPARVRPSCRTSAFVAGGARSRGLRAWTCRPLCPTRPSTSPGDGKGHARKRRTAPKDRPARLEAPTGAARPSSRPRPSVEPGPGESPPARVRQVYSTLARPLGRDLQGGVEPVLRISRNGTIRSWALPGRRAPAGPPRRPAWRRRRDGHDMVS